MGCTASGATQVVVEGADGRKLKSAPSSRHAERATPNPQESGSFNDKYALGSLIGAGSFAQVHIAMRHSSGAGTSSERCAVKVIDFKASRSGSSEEADPKKRKLAEHEAAIWGRLTKLQNPHCVRLHEVFQADACSYMVMELCEETLLRHLENTPEVTESVLARLFKQMVLALQGLHDGGIVHRDVKPDNFLVKGGNTLKLCDFGLAAALPRDRIVGGAVGTPPFMSPEMLIEGRYTEKTDLWSLGVLIYLFLYGHFPYCPQEGTKEAMKQVIREGKVSPSYRPVKLVSATAPRPSKMLEQLVRLLLYRDSDGRPCAEAVLRDRYWRSQEYSPSSSLHVAGSDIPPVPSPTDSDLSAGVRSFGSLMSVESNKCFRPMLRAAFSAGALGAQLDGKSSRGGAFNTGTSPCATCNIAATPSAASTSLPPPVPCEHRRGSLCPTQSEHDSTDLGKFVVDWLSHCDSDEGDC